MSEDSIIRSVIAAAVIFVVFVIVAFIIDTTTENACNALGWPSHNMTITFSRYCIARTNQTDVIVPLDSARRMGMRRVAP